MKRLVCFLFMLLFLLGSCASDVQETHAYAVNPVIPVIQTQVSQPWSSDDLRSKEVEVTTATAPMPEPEPTHESESIRVLWLGNSLIEGFRLYAESDVEESYLCKVGISLHTFIKDYKKAIQEADYNVVVCEFGTNEANHVTKEGFLSDYNSLHDMVGDATFYVMEIPKAATTNRVPEMNEWLRELDNTTVIPVDSSKFSYAKDGVHLSIQSYIAWHDETLGFIIS